MTKGKMVSTNDLKSTPKKHGEDDDDNDFKTMIT